MNLKPFIYKKAALINVLTPAFYQTLKDVKKVSEKQTDIYSQCCRL